MKIKKRLFAVMFAVMLMSLMVVSAFAAAGDPVDTTEVLKGAFESVTGDMMESVGVIVPIAAPILGVGIVIGFTIKLFRKLTAKAS
jgi:type IV secretory pathway VirB2 component (pilin)